MIVYFDWRMRCDVQDVRIYEVETSGWKVDLNYYFYQM